MIKTWVNFFWGGRRGGRGRRGERKGGVCLSQNEQIQFLGSQMYCPVIEIYSLRKKLKNYSGEINPLGVHRTMRGCILEISLERLGWYSTVFLFTILLILT